MKNAYRPPGWPPCRAAILFLMILGLEIGTLKEVCAAGPAFTSTVSHESARRESFLNRMNAGQKSLSEQDQINCQKLGLYPTTCLLYVEKRQIEQLVVQKFPLQVLLLGELYAKKRLVFSPTDETMHLKIALANGYLTCSDSSSSEQVTLCLPETIFKVRETAIFKSIPPAELTEPIRAAMISVAKFGVRMPLGPVGRP
jgi:hypothetical protein